jgi:chloramphenicol-sensitive protein RarD
MTALLGYVLIGEQLKRIQWISVGLCALSCMLVGLSSWLELGFSFFTALTYALYLITQRKNQGFDRIVILGIQVMFSLLILSFMFDQLVETIPSETKFYFIILIIAVVFTVIPLFLNLFALNKVSSASIGILMYLNPIFNFSVAFIVFNEKVTWLQITGYSIIVVGLVMFNAHNLSRLQSSWLKRVA